MTRYRCHYFCDACPNEWADPLPQAGPSHCPCCDALCEPYSVEALAPPPYPFCRTPVACAGKGYCPQEYACND